MLTSTNPTPPSRRAGTARVGLALAGGGPLGAIYEIGALCALQEALPDVDFSDLSGYVGVSAGSFVAAALANGMTPRQLCAAFIENNARSEDLVQPSVFMRPAVGELARRVAALPGLTLQAAYRYAFKGDSLLSALERLGRALPTGVFSHAALEAQVRRLLTVPGRSNDFRRLGHRLVLVATDLDRGSSAPSACRAGTTCPSRRPWPPAPRCRGCSRRWPSTAAGTWTER